jgi:hypothetical protein
MSRLYDYRTALLAANPNTAEGQLFAALDERPTGFSRFVVDMGLGPLWHQRTGRAEFHESRLQAEALYLAQQAALREIDAALNDSGIDYAMIKGAATRLLLYDNPALRACYDLDLLVRPADRVRAAATLAKAGFTAKKDARCISRELVLSSGAVDIDLHWGLLREGRLRRDFTADMVDRRRRAGDLWMLDSEDMLFVLLVHPAFAKHLAGWNMGLHRVADVLWYLQAQSCNWPLLWTRLADSGVQTAAWATLRWLQLLTEPETPTELDAMLMELRPGRVRRAWLERWLSRNLSERTARMHWARLIGFSLFLHDTPRDALRALGGRYRAHRRRENDLAVFRELFA